MSSYLATVVHSQGGGGGARHSDPKISPGMSRSRWLSSRSRSRDNGHGFSSQAALGEGSKGWVLGANGLKPFQEGQASVSQGQRGVLPGSCW